jgi:hypothetical protein
MRARSVGSPFCRALGRAGSDGLPGTFGGWPSHRRDGAPSTSDRSRPKPVPSTKGSVHRLSRRAYNNKTKTGFTLTKIKEWYNTRERTQTHKRDSGYHSFTPETPKQQFQIDLIMLPKPWRNNRYKYAMVCIDTFSKKADSATWNQ